MREAARSIGQIILSSGFLLALLLLVAKVNVAVDIEDFVLRRMLEPDMPPKFADVQGVASSLADAVSDSGRFAIAASAAGLFVIVVTFIGRRLVRKPDPHVDFTATDGSHVNLRPSMPPKEIRANAERIRAQLEVFEKAAVPAEQQDR